jgi:hypothetical protein
MGLRAVAAIGTAGALGAYALLARPRQLCWGSTIEEAHDRLPGDQLIPHPHLVATRAITVRAPADAVWPWIAQLGQGRGGFYSYDFLENLFGCDIHSADRIVGEWQDVAAGDEIRLFPDGRLTVAYVERGLVLVLRGLPTGDGWAPPFDFTWAFELRPQPDGSTRLLIRERYGHTKWWGQLMIEPIEAISFVMHQKMLRGIKERAESSAHVRTG